MKSLLHKIFKKNREPRALVLMYHRVAEPTSDIWDIAVSPANFEQHLQVLKQAGNIIPLQKLVDNLHQKKLKEKSIAITFDDGYADNYYTAKPLLEKYALPATFFVTSVNINKETAFWWDELEQIILYEEQLPFIFDLTIADNTLMFHLEDEAQLNERHKRLNRQWKACDAPPPSLRCELFLKLWQQLKILSPTEQQQHLQAIRSWSGTDATTPAAYKSMSATQLQNLAGKELFSIGAHTVSHVALSYHSLQVQEQELQENKKYLKSITNNEISFLSYPYGDYNKDTVAATLNSAFKAAFTTEEKLATSRSDIYTLGRFQVKNWSGTEFSSHIKQWLSQKKQKA